MIKQLAAVVSIIRESDEQEFKYFSFEEQVFQEMTVAQLDQLAAAEPWFASDETFKGIQFQKRFAEDLSSENIESMTSQEKLENLQRIYSLAKANDMPKKLLLEYLMQILTIGPKVGVFDKASLLDLVQLSEEPSDFYKDHVARRQKRKEKAS